METGNTNPQIQDTSILDKNPELSEFERQVQFSEFVPSPIALLTPRKSAPSLGVLLD